MSPAGTSNYDFFHFVIDFHEKCAIDTRDFIFSIRFREYVCSRMRPPRFRGAGRQAASVVADVVSSNAIN